MESTIIKHHYSLKIQRTTDKKSTFIIRYVSNLTIGLLGLIAVICGRFFADKVLNVENVFPSIGILTSVILFFDAVLKLVLLKPKIDFLLPYLVLPISKKQIIREILLTNLFDIRHYVSLFCIITFLFLLYFKAMIDIMFVIHCLLFTTAILLFNSLLTICIKNFNLLVTVIAVIVCFTYFAVLFSIVQEKIYPIHFFDNLSNIIISLCSLVLGIILYTFAIYKLVIRIIYGINSNYKVQQLSFIQSNADLLFVLKMFLRAKPSSYWYLLCLLLFPLIGERHLAGNNVITICILIVFGAFIFTRFINIHKLVSCYADGLITRTQSFFKSLLSGLYNLNIIYSLYWCTMIYYYSINIYYSISCFFLSLGICPLMNFIYTIYDPGRYNIFSPMFNGQNNRYFYTNLKTNIILCSFLIFTIVMCCFLYSYLLLETATTIIAAQGFIFFFTKKFWLNKLNDIYIKNRYENLAKCRGEKFYK